MGSFQKVKLHSIVLYATLAVISCQRLSSTLFEGRRGCPGHQVNFTCVTTGSIVLAWNSDEYIGQNGAQIEFTSADGVNRTKASSINSNTVATLIRINGTRVIESLLSIIVLDSFPTASVTCGVVGQGSDSTITFQPLAVPGIPQNVTADILASTSDDCAILLKWMPPSIAESSVNHYVIDSPSGSFTTKDTSVEITLLIHHCNSTTYIRIHAVDYCGRDSPSTNNMLGLLLTNTTLPPVTESRNATDSNQNSGQQKSNTSTAAIVGGVLGGVIMLSIIITLSVALGVVSNRMPLVGRLPREQLEQALRERLQATTTNKSESVDASSSEPKNTKLKKKVYVVRSKHINDISHKALLKYDADDENTIDIPPQHSPL